MKKIIGAILIFATLIGALFTLNSCEKSGYKDYNEAGLHFRIPSDFRKFTIFGYDLHYSTPEAKFEVKILSKADIEDIELGYYISFNWSVKDYTEFLIKENQWQCQYEYDEARDVTTFFLLYAPPAESEELAEYEYLYVTVLKNDVAFYIVVMSCEEELVSKYESKFKTWSTYLSAK